MMWKHDMHLWQAALVVALPASILVAYIIHHFAEVKATRWLKGKLMLTKK
jgi:peptidoglycan/LPS O-acetylase OafA/YrhL